MVVYLIQLLLILLQVFNFILLARVLLSWFPNVDYSNPVVRFLYEVTEPILRPVRELLPQTSGIDLSPLVVFVLIYVFTQLLRTF